MTAAVRLFSTQNKPPIAGCFKSIDVLQSTQHIFSRHTVSDQLSATLGTFMPMTGMFAKMSSGGDGIGGRLALVVWCVYFLPIGILSFIHFNKDGMRYEKR